MNIADQILAAADAWAAVRESNAAIGCRRGIITEKAEAREAAARAKLEALLRKLPRGGSYS